MKQKLLIAFCWFVACMFYSRNLQAQSPQPPDCVINLNNFVGNGNTATFDNRYVGCVTWTMAVQSSGFSAVSVTFQSATGAVTPGTWGSYGGTTLTGANPITSTTGETSTFANKTVITPWLRALVAVTGTGNLNGVVYGYKSGNSAGTGGGGSSGCVGTTATPCVVDGPTASGSAPTTPPVLVAGLDGTNLWTLKTDGSGRLLNGAYPTLAAITLTTSGLTRIITHSASLVTTVGSYNVSFASTTTFQLEYGTTVSTACDTGTTALTGVYQNVATIAIDNPFIVPAGQDLCVNLGSSVNGGGVIVYAQP